MTRYRIARFFKYAFLIVVAFISAFPFYWMIVSSTNNTVDVVIGKMTFGDQLLVNWQNLTADGTLVRSFLNSLRNAFAITVCALLVSSMAGYAFVVFRDKAKDFVMKLILLSMMVPMAATLIPLYRLFASMKLVNTLPGVMLPSIATAFLIFMFRQGAQTFPQEIVQAARIDGMGEFGIFFRIFVPVMRPTYAAAATVTFMSAWNAYLWPLVVLNTDTEKTMPLFIEKFQSLYVLDYGVIMLSVTIATIPTLIIFFVLQKSFVEGILGSIK